MRTNRLKEVMKAGRPVFGTLVSLPEPGIVEIIGNAGFDFAVIDMEHSPIDFSHLRTMLAAGECAGLVPLVRVGTCEANPILRVLDSGAFGVMAAHVQTKDDALALVRASRYPPVGIRGVNSSTRATGFGRDNFLEHVQRSNEQVLTIALVEDHSGVEAIEEIVEVEGLDVVLPGPGDLSASMGLLGQLQHPKVQEDIDHVAQAVHTRPGLVLGCFVTDPSQICRCEELDARFVVFGQDSGHLFKAYQGALVSMRQQWGA